MRYIHVTWIHDFPDEPTEYYSEVGDDQYEVRRVQVYRDGRMDWADEFRETDSVGLSEIPIDLDEIRSQDEFLLAVIDRAAFEAAWDRAGGSR